MSTLLITRPHEDAASLAAAVRDMGWEPLIEPLLEIRFRDQPLPSLDPFQAILFTSANGVRAFARLTDERRHPVLAVGDATARTALAEGFTRVESAGGTVEDLARLATAVCQPEYGPLLHAAGSKLAGDLAKMLADDGFSLSRVVIYDAIQATELSPKTQRALAEDQFLGAVLYSPRTAHTFSQLLVKAGQQPATRRVSLFCLSPAVAKAAEISNYTWQNVCIAPEPTQNALLALLTSTTKSLLCPSSSGLLNLS